MSIWGKLIGGATGMALGGPIGAILGIAAGHGVDKVRKFDADEGNKNFRGNEGPLHISDLTSPHPLAKLFIETAHSIGIKKNTDYNSGDQEGSFLYQTMIKNSMRWSASDAYLKPRRKNKIPNKLKIYPSKTKIYTHTLYVYTNI